MRFKKLLGLMMLVVLSSDVWAKPPRFWTPTQVVGILVNSAAMSADIYTTREALQRPGVFETNPLMKNPGVAIGIKAGEVGAAIGLSYLLYKGGHRKLARELPFFMAAPSGLAAWSNSQLK